MSFSMYWKRKCDATPQLQDEDAKLTITTGSLRKEIEKAYRQGRADERALHSPGKSGASVFEDLFSQAAEKP